MTKSLHISLKSAHKSVTFALLCLNLPILPYFVMLCVILVVSNFNFLRVFLGFLNYDNPFLYLFLGMCLYLFPIYAFFFHLKKCLRTRKIPSIKRITIQRIFFIFGLIVAQCINSCLLILYARVGLTTFSLLIPFLLMTILIGGIFAFNAFIKVYVICNTAQSTIIK